MSKSDVRSKICNHLDLVDHSAVVIVLESPTRVKFPRVLSLIKLFDLLVLFLSREPCLPVVPGRWCRIFTLFKKIRNHSNKNLRGGIAKPRTLEVVSNLQSLKVNSERALAPAAHWQSRLADTVQTVPTFVPAIAH